MGKKRNRYNGRNQLVKKKFRKTEEWRQFRQDKIYEQNHLDYITGKRLLIGCNCHHLDMNVESYDDISDSSNFIALNRDTHEMIHELYKLYRNDPSVMDRIGYVLRKMLYLNDREVFDSLESEQDIIKAPTPKNKGMSVI